MNASTFLHYCVVMTVNPNPEAGLATLSRGDEKSSGTEEFFYKGRNFR